jgi:hypothetical protein
VERRAFDEWLREHALLCADQPANTRAVYNMENITNRVETKICWSMAKEKEAVPLCHTAFGFAHARAKNPICIPLNEGQATHSHNDIRVMRALSEKCYAPHQDAAAT